MPITHAEVLGRPLVTANKDALAATNVTGLLETSSLQARITPGKNLLFSTAFPLVWEQVSRVGGSTILMQYDPPICVGSQGDGDYRHDLDASAFYATGDYGKGDILARTREGLARHFGGAAVPALIPDAIDPDHLFAYAYLFKSLAYDERGGRVALIARDERAEDFILDLPLVSPDDRLVIASIRPSETLAETAMRALMPRAPFAPSGMPATFALESYRVPKIHFDVTWKHRTTSARYVLRLDEFGATVLSEAAQMALPLPGIIVARPGGPTAAPLLIVAAKRSARRPYFAAWIESTELLIPDAWD
jgi:hypothetical protein